MFSLTFALPLQFLRQKNSKNKPEFSRTVLKTHILTGEKALEKKPQDLNG